MLTREHKVLKAPDLLGSEIDGELVLLGIASGKYYKLDAIGTDIWQRLDSQPLVADLCQALAQDYDAEPAQIEQDVINMLNVLAEHELISVLPAN